MFYNGTDADEGAPMATDHLPNDPRTLPIDVAARLTDIESRSRP
jgi:hypothetical protein